MAFVISKSDQCSIFDINFCIQWYMLGHDLLAACYASISWSVAISMQNHDLYSMHIRLYD